MHCSYCGSKAINVLVPEETIIFRNKEVKLTNITYKHCTNPDCPEPDWISAKEGLKREAQIREQIGEPPLVINNNLN